MEINGVAHTFITAGNFKASRDFYARLLPFLGLRVVADTDNTFYCVGGRTGFGIHAPTAEHQGQRFRQGSVGLHHHCWRARERADVDAAHAFLAAIGARIVHAPQQDNFAPGYYSVLFEDPDGTRLEINHVPGRGLLEPGTRIGGGYADGTQNDQKV
jgi:catechol 2,3-dioxygenase-like lactoylglutathione lyase family enzyme